MPKTVFAMITLLDDGSIDPGFGNRPGGGGNRPDNSLPGNIHHPGHPDHGKPIDPDYGQGDHRPHPGNRPPGSTGGRPDNSLPWSPGSPDNSLPVPPGVQPPPAPGGALKDKLVVLWHVPGQTAWHGKVIDPATMNRPDQGLPGGGQPDQELPENPEPKA